MHARIRWLAFLLLVMIVEPAAGQNQEKLAARLANDKTRRAAVGEIAAGGKELEQVLLGWTLKLPANVSPDDIKLGMAEAFERLRSQAAIPFLIANIGISPAPAVRTYPSSANVLFGSPAMRALIAIGDPAVEPLVEAYMGPLDLQTRFHVLFTLSRMRGPRVRYFLEKESGALAEMQSYVKSGLRRLDAEGGDKKPR